MNSSLIFPSITILTLIKLLTAKPQIGKEIQSEEKQKTGLLRATQ